MEQPKGCITNKAPIRLWKTGCGRPLNVRTRAAEILETAYSKGTKFRPGQVEAIEALVKDRKRVLVVQRTGWGKSAVYFIAAKILAEEQKALTLVVSPLLSLMRNQIQASSEQFGLRTFQITSENWENHDAIRTAILSKNVDVLLISPERLANNRFLDETLLPIADRIGCLVIDEAHCISDWGHDFRPDYQRITRLLSNLPPKVPVIATTATANNRVVDDIATQLGAGLYELRGPLTRDSLHLQNIRLKDQAERLAWLATHVPKIPKTGIIYCLTKRDTRRVAAWLQKKGIDVLDYSAGVDGDERVVREDKLQGNSVKALVATVALGMGYDKPDLGFVVHFQRPGSIVHYYQQIGRAGRNIDKAHIILLNGREDDEIQDFFIRNAFPEPSNMYNVLAAVEKSESGLTARQIESQVNLPSKKIEKCLKFLVLQQAVIQKGQKFVRTTNPWKPDRAKQELVTKIRRNEVKRMQEYMETKDCLMEFIAKELDDPTAKRCGKCANCTAPTFPTDVDRELVHEATRFLRGDFQTIEPKKMLFTEDGSMQRIPEAELAEQGRALCVYDDAGWGRIVSEDKYKHKRFREDLVQATVDLVQDRWEPKPPVAWVTSMPSTRSGNLVAEFAKAVAKDLDLPYLDSLEKTRPTESQKAFENNHLKFLNVNGSLRVRGKIPDGPVLLIDDMVDSGWTLANAVRELRRAGCPQVFPFAIADAGGQL